MDLKKIETELKAFLKEKGYTLYELNHLKKDNILQVVLDESLDMEQIEQISNDVSDFMDRYDEELDAYLLDVCTAGIERPIRNGEEMKRAVGSYVCVKTKEAVYEGTLYEVTEEELRMSVKDKTRDKLVTIPKKQVKKMRYAVKF